MPDHEGVWTIDQVIEAALARVRGDAAARDAMLAGFAETSGRVTTMDEFEADFRSTARPVLDLLRLAGFKVMPLRPLVDLYMDRSTIVDGLQKLYRDSEAARAAHAAISVIEEACVALVPHGSAEHGTHMHYAVGSAWRAGQQRRAETLAARYGIALDLAECPYYEERGA